MSSTRTVFDQLPPSHARNFDRRIQKSPTLNLGRINRRFPDLQPFLADVEGDPLSDLFSAGFGFGVEPAL